MSQFCCNFIYIIFEDVTETNIKGKDIGKVEQNNSSKNNSSVFQFMILMVGQKTTISTFAEISEKYEQCFLNMTMFRNFLVYYSRLTSISLQ